MSADPRPLEEQLREAADRVDVYYKDFRLAEVLRAAAREGEDLAHKVQFLVDFIPCEDGGFTFPDGDRWDQTKKPPVEVVDLMAALKKSMGQR